MYCSCWPSLACKQVISVMSQCSLEACHIMEACLLGSFKQSQHDIDACSAVLQGDPTKYATYLATRPKSYEAQAVALLIDVLKRTREERMTEGFKLHIVHLANADLLHTIRQAAAEGERHTGSCVHICPSLMKVSSVFCVSLYTKRNSSLATASCSTKPQ